MPVQESLFHERIEDAIAAGADRIERLERPALRTAA